MNQIGFQASASTETAEQKQPDAKEEYSLIVRPGSVVRRNGQAESELSFAVCLWGGGSAAGVGLHAPDGLKAMVARLAMLLAHDEMLRALVSKACEHAELMAAVQGEE